MQIAVITGILLSCIFALLMMHLIPVLISITIIFPRFIGHRARTDERDQPGFDHFGFPPRFGDLGPIDGFRPGMPFGELHPPSLQATGFNPLGPGKA